MCCRSTPGVSCVSDASRIMSRDFDHACRSKRSVQTASFNQLRAEFLSEISRRISHACVLCIRLDSWFVHRATFHFKMSIRISDITIRTLRLRASHFRWHSTPAVPERQNNRSREEDVVLMKLLEMDAKK